MARPPVPDPIHVPTVSVPYAGRCLGMARSTSYKAADDGMLPTVRLSQRRIAVPTIELRRMLGLPDHDRCPCAAHHAHAEVVGLPDDIGEAAAEAVAR